MTINNTVQGRRRVLFCDFSLETPRTCEGVERGVLGTGEAQWWGRGARKMFKGRVPETTVQKHRHRGSGVGEPEGPRTLATMAGVKGQEAPGEEPGVHVEGRWAPWPDLGI